MWFGRRALDIASRHLSAALGLDIALYRGLYPDLASMAPWDLLRHYMRAGRMEGRIPNVRAAFAAQRKGAGLLPENFSCEAYASLNPDVAEAHRDEPGLAAHYLLHGRHEQRRFALFDDNFYRALYGFDGATSSTLKEDYERHARDGTRYRNWSELTRAYGMAPGPWLELFEPYDFCLLSPDWSGLTGTKPHAVAAFLDHGLERLTPIRLDLTFEPDYYAEANPERAALKPAEAYRHWLLQGLPRGETGSARARLSNLDLDLSVFPEAFDWRSHIHRRDLAIASRWDALEDLVVHARGSAEQLDLVSGVDHEGFVRALCEAASTRGDPQAVLAFASRAVTPCRRLTVLRAHAFYELGRWADADALYRTVLTGQTDEQLWSRAALASARSGDLRDAVEILRLGATVLSSSAVWRTAAKNVLGLVFAAEDTENGPFALSQGIVRMLYPSSPLALTDSGSSVVIEDHRPEVSIDAIFAARDITIVGATRSPERLQIEAAAQALTYHRYAPSGDLASEPRRPRVLIVNTFFPPDDIGGATAVVRENINDWRASGALDEFDVAVVCADMSGAEIGLIRPDRQMSLSVFRIGVADDPLTDQRHSDTAVEAAFTRVLKAVEPDLVHFHSVQRLTGSVVDACIMSGISYLVTLHDGWWLSEHQFFVDAQGAFTGDERDAALVRRRDNLLRLSKARQVLAVSEWTAQAYAQAGVQNIVAVSNGLPERPQVARRLRSGGALRLGHLGGVARIKGYHLLEAALKRNAFSNLQVTVIDQHHSEGYERFETWGATPVRIIGALKPQRVQEFYADLDVLVAPSVAPETYGLAVREALAAGLWVVSSDRGAAAEAITPGENGFVIDVSEAAPLIRILDDLNRGPDRFRAPPKKLSVLQSSAVQARTLAAIYRDEIGAAAPRA